MSILSSEWLRMAERLRDLVALRRCFTYRRYANEVTLIFSLNGSTC